jgi:hypothetical protein
MAYIPWPSHPSNRSLLKSPQPLLRHPSFFGTLPEHIFSNTFDLQFSPNIYDVLLSYKTKYKYITWLILNFKFVDRKPEDEIF